MDAGTPAVILISWDQIEEETVTAIADPDGEQLILSRTCTDDELVTFVRQHNGDEEDPDGDWGTDWLGRPNTYGWLCAAVTRGPNTATIEWLSDRGHLAATTIIWA